MSLLPEFLVILAMLAINAVFAAYEMALATVSRARLAVLADRGRRGAIAAARMKDRMEASLAVIQVGITLVGAIAAATGGAGTEEFLSPLLSRTLGISDSLAEALAITLFVIPLSIVTILFGELIPKVVAIRNKERICLLLAPAMLGLANAFHPVVTGLERLVKAVVNAGQKRLPPGEGSDEPETNLHELRAAAGLARSARLIGARQERIVLSASLLSVRPVREIMLPAPDITMIPETCSLMEAFERAHLDLHTRFPVCRKEGDPQSIIGYVNFKDIVTALKTNPTDPSLPGILRPIQRIEEGLSISEALESLMRDKTHIALVVSGARILGLVTLEDIIEEMLGEIEDEFDRLPSHVHPAGQGWIVGGGAPMDRVAAAVGVPWPGAPDGQRAPSLAAWAARALGRQPRGSEVFSADGLRVMVRKTRRNRVYEAQIGKVG